MGDVGIVILLQDKSVLGQFSKKNFKNFSKFSKSRRNFKPEKKKIFKNFFRIFQKFLYGHLFHRKCNNFWKKNFFWKKFFFEFFSKSGKNIDYFNLVQEKKLFVSTYSTFWYQNQVHSTYISRDIIFSFVELIKNGRGPIWGVCHGKKTGKLFLVFLETHWGIINIKPLC